MTLLPLLFCLLPLAIAKKSPPLPLLLRQLRADAARSGEDRSVTLSGGARVAFRMLSGRVTFAVSRKGVRVGDRELIVFQAAAGVPSGAVRMPAEGQTPINVADECWFRVCFVWSE